MKIKLVKDTKMSLVVLSSNAYSSGWIGESVFNFKIKGYKYNCGAYNRGAWLGDCLGWGKGSYRSFVKKSGRLSTVLATLPNHLLRTGNYQ